MVQIIGNRCVESCDTRFRKKADTPSLILNGLIVSGKEAIKLDFNIAKTPTTFYCLFALVKDTLERTLSRLNCWVMSLFTQMEGVLVPQKMLLLT